MMLCTESVVDQTDHFVCENVAWDNVMMFESLQPMPFFLEKSIVRNRIFQCLAAFSVRIWLE